MLYGAADAAVRHLRHLEHEAKKRWRAQDRAHGIDRFITGEERMGSFSIWHWAIVLAIVMLIFGTRKLGSVGTDLGAAVRNFKQGLKETGDEPQPADPGGHAVPMPLSPPADRVAGGR